MPYLECIIRKGTMDRGRQAPRSEGTHVEMAMVRTNRAGIMEP